MPHIRIELDSSLSALYCTFRISDDQKQKKKQTNNIIDVNKMHFNIRLSENFLNKK